MLLYVLHELRTDKAWVVVVIQNTIDGAIRVTVHGGTSSLGRGEGSGRTKVAGSAGFPK